MPRRHDVPLAAADRRGRSARHERPDRLPGASNYLVGSDPRGWRTNVPAFGRVVYHSVYRGTDLVYHGNAGRLEYDFVLAPGAVQPSSIWPWAV